MNLLGIDYGTKKIGLAIAINDIISPLTVIKNDDTSIRQISQIITDYQIHKIYVGVSQGNFADVTKNFVASLKSVLQLSVETVDETVSTIEADKIFQSNKGKLKNYHRTIDSIAAAVILSRVIYSHH